MDPKSRGTLQGVVATQKFLESFSSDRSSYVACVTALSPAVRSWIDDVTNALVFGAGIDARGTNMLYWRALLRLLHSHPTLLRTELAVTDPSVDEDKEDIFRLVSTCLCWLALCPPPTFIHQCYAFDELMRTCAVIIARHRQPLERVLAVISLLRYDKEQSNSKEGVREAETTRRDMSWETDVSHGLGAALEGTSILDDSSRFLARQWIVANCSAEEVRRAVSRLLRWPNCSSWIIPMIQLARSDVYQFDANDFSIERACSALVAQLAFPNLAWNTMDVLEALLIPVSSDAHAVRHLMKHLIPLLKGLKIPRPTTSNRFVKHPPKRARTSVEQVWLSGMETLRWNAIQSAISAQLDVREISTMKKKSEEVTGVAEENDAIVQSSDSNQRSCTEKSDEKDVIPPDTIRGDREEVILEQDVLERLSHVIHLLMLLYPGHPTLYAEVIATLPPHLASVPSSVQAAFKSLRSGSYTVRKPHTYHIQCLRDTQKVPAGLRNIGNTCFINSIMQAIYHSTPFICELMNESGASPTIRALQILFAEMLSSKRDVLDTTKFVSVLPKQFQRRTQEDAAELFHVLLDQLPERLSTAFQVHMKSTITCSAGHSSMRDETSLGMCVPLPEKPEPLNSLSLTSLLSTTVMPTKLTGNDAYCCESCNARVDATKTLSVVGWPDCLSFTIMRFYYDVKTKTRRKRSDWVQIPAAIKITQQPDGTLQFYDDRDDNNSDEVPLPSYSLYAIVHHAGISAHHGHYHCFAKSFLPARSWFDFNDSDIEPTHSLTETSVLRQQHDDPYLIFYLRDGVACDAPAIQSADLKDKIEVENAKLTFEYDQLMTQRKWGRFDPRK